MVIHSLRLVSVTYAYEGHTSFLNRAWDENDQFNTEKAPHARVIKLADMRRPHRSSNPSRKAGEKNWVCDKSYVRVIAIICSVKLHHQVSSQLGCRRSEDVFSETSFILHRHSAMETLNQLIKLQIKVAQFILYSWFLRTVLEDSGVCLFNDTSVMTRASWCKFTIFLNHILTEDYQPHSRKSEPSTLPQSTRDGRSLPSMEESRRVARLPKYVET